jgi:arylsulfatase A-like enzyme
VAGHSTVGRRAVVKALGAISALSASGVAAAAGSVAAAKGRGAQKPNVLFIMADDMGYGDLSLTGSHHIKTPAIDSIARNGLFLRHGYANSPICSPSRTALLSGCYQYRFAVGLDEPLGAQALATLGLPLDRPTLASVFRDSGYHTKLIGKWHLGEPPHHGPLQYGYDEFFGIVEGAADYFRHHMVMGGKDVGIGLARGNEATTADGYLTDLFGDETVKTIEQAGHTPFFISLHFNAPHWPWEGREDAELARKQGASFHYDGGSLAAYRAMMAAMDENIGKALDALKRSGKADNTIVVFTSDNGGERFSETWPFTGTKGEVLEGGIRVPILMQWPLGITAGTVSEQMMAGMDFLPTLLALAGGTPPKDLDGVDLSPQILGKAASMQRALYWRFKANDQAAMREGDWKYVKLGGKEHLFNLAQDERERADMAPDEPERLGRMRAAWAAWNAPMLPYPAGSYSENVRDHYPDRY